MTSRLLRTSIAGLSLRNPFILASGVLDMTGDLMIRIAKDGAGAVTTKSIGLHPQSGHEGPNIAITSCGIVNAMGLPNPGCEAFTEEIRIYKSSKQPAPLIASVFGKTEQEFAVVAKKLEDAGADAIEINISCPHSDEKLMAFGLDPKKTKSITSEVHKAITVPLFLKLPGNTNIPSFKKVAEAALTAGASGLVATNTLPAIAIDFETGAPVLGHVVGGLSGPGIHPIGVRLIFELAKLTDKTLVGVGGVQSLPDALAYFSVGASAVQLATSLFTYDTTIFKKLCEALEHYMLDRKIKSIKEIVGRIHRWI
ncbi:MAG: dihydroorotate dehydrogenase, partial [Candidatus Ranarchaeia archaeon]